MAPPVPSLPQFQVPHTEKYYSNKGAIDFWGAIPNGTFIIPLTGIPVTFNSFGNRNTLEVTPGGIPGVISLNIKLRPTYLLDDNGVFGVKLSFAAGYSETLAGVGVVIVGISLSTEAVTIKIGNETESYTRGDLNTLLQNLSEANVPDDIALELKEQIEGVLGEEKDRVIDTYIPERVEALDKTADASNVLEDVTVNFVSGTFIYNDSSEKISLGLADNVIGTSFNDTLIGNDDSNVLEGGSGDDRLEGGAGADVLRGSLGNDTIYFDAEDTVVLGGEEEDDRDVGFYVAADAGDGLTANADDLELEVLFGGAGDDELILNNQSYGAATLAEWFTKVSERSIATRQIVFNGLL